MDSHNRRELILSSIENSDKPMTGACLSKQFNVSRQVIVQDIAILRAAGHEIFATPQGYMMSHKDIPKRYSRILALKHNIEQISDELMTMVDLGGKIVDVIIEHPLYGEFKGQLKINSPSNVREYMDRMKKEGGEPLSSLTEGVHLHTIEADSQYVLDQIEKVLDQKGFLLSKD